MNRIQIVDKATLAFLCLMVVSIYYSMYLLSISMIGFVFFALVRLAIERSDSGVLIDGKIWPYLAVSLIFISTLFSGLNSEDIGYWIRHLRLKLPFLLLPAAFYVHRKCISANFEKICFLFFCVGLASTIPVLLEMNDFDNMISTIKRGQALETPVDHIKYSLYLAYSILIGIVLFVENRLDWFRGEKILLAAGSIYLFVFIHLLAVRSGLAVFYISSFFILLMYALKLRKKELWVGLVLLAFAPIIAFNSIPSFKKKFEYMKYDYEMYKQGKGQSHSDSERLYSYQVGWDIYKKSPLIGCGIGDLKAECIKTYKSLFGIEGVEKYPHNQFLFILAGSGWIGLILFLIGMVYPALYFRKGLDSLFLAILILALISFLVENTIERSYGIAFILLFLLSSMTRMTSDYFKEEIASNPHSKYPL